MTTDKEYCELIEKINKEYFDILSSKQYLYGRKVANIIGALKKHKIRSLLAAWIQGIKIRRTCCKRDNSNYIYGNYPNRNLRFCVYTCITGNYDNLQPIHIRPQNVDYIAFTDNPNIKPNGWIVMDLPDIVKNIKGHANRNRYLKMHPNLVGYYDYALYVDGLVEIYSDITNLVNVIDNRYGIAIHNHFSRDCVYEEVKFCNILKLGNCEKMIPMIKKYKEEGYPKHNGLLECTVILTDLKNDISISILDEWWKEHLQNETKRDQLSLPYILWKRGININHIGTLGNNVKTNPKFRINGHAAEFIRPHFKL